MRAIDVDGYFDNIEFLRLGIFWQFICIIQIEFVNEVWKVVFKLIQIEFQYKVQQNCIQNEDIAIYS